MRCEQEALIAVTPFENPCAERAAAVADEFATAKQAFGAAPTIQRVAAVEASVDGAQRSSSPSAPLSAAASDSRRRVTMSISPWRSSPITARTARQRSASSIAHKRSRVCAAETVSRRSG